MQYTLIQSFLKYQKFVFFSIIRMFRHYNDEFSCELANFHCTDESVPMCSACLFIVFAVSSLPLHKCVCCMSSHCTCSCKCTCTLSVCKFIVFAAILMQFFLCIRKVQSKIYLTYNVSIAISDNSLFSLL